MADVYKQPFVDSPSVAGTAKDNPSLVNLQNRLANIILLFNPAKGAQTLVPTGSTSAGSIPPVFSHIRASVRDAIVAELNAMKNQLS